VSLAPRQSQVAAVAGAASGVADVAAEVIVIGDEEPSSGCRQVDELLGMASQGALLDVCEAKPTVALKRLAEWVEVQGSAAWQKRAKVAAIMGSCPKSQASFKSGASVALCCF
jgi:hypothetical protein